MGYYLDDASSNDERLMLCMDNNEELLDMELP